MQYVDSSFREIIEVAFTMTLKINGNKADGN